MQTRVLVLLCLLGIVGLTGTQGLRAQDLGVPQLVNYQGKLADAEGQPPPTRDYTLSFSIYDDPAATACSSEVKSACARRVWGPQVFDGKTDAVGHGLQVPVVRGFFNVILGPYDIHGTPILQGFTSSNRFLEVTVAGDDPVLPRQQVLSTPFALASAGAVPVGGIIAYSGSPDALHDNWMICNGDDIDDADSPLNGAKVPDLRGVFVRGTEDKNHASQISGNDFYTHSHTTDIDWELNTSRRVTRYYSEPYVTPEDSDSSDFWLYGAGSFDVSRRYRALEVRVSDDVSHAHSIEIDTHEKSQTIRTTTIPRHMSLYYAMRIK